MKTPTKYPRHRFTAETAFRIDQLHCAAADLFRRSSRHYERGDYERGGRCMEAAFRLQRRAFTLGMRALSPAQLDRFCKLQEADQAERKARQATTSVVDHTVAA